MSPLLLLLLLVQLVSQVRFPLGRLARWKIEGDRGDVTVGHHLQSEHWLNKKHQNKKKYLKDYATVGHQLQCKGCFNENRSHFYLKDYVLVAVAEGRAEGIGCVCRTCPDGESFCQTIVLYFGSF